MKKILCAVAIVCSVSSGNCIYQFKEPFSYCLAKAREIARPLCSVVGYFDIPLAIGENSLVIESNYNQECLCAIVENIQLCIGHYAVEWYHVLVGTLVRGVETVMWPLQCNNFK